MVILRTFIFGTVMHLVWVYSLRKNYASVANIFQFINFKQIAHFALFELINSFLHYLNEQDSFLADLSSLSVDSSLVHRNLTSCMLLCIRP